jgi:cytoskeletal protein CcmA (bactofilin family)
MADVTVIGRGANIIGTVSGAVDLTIHGRVEGEISAEGEVTIEAEGLVAASVTGRRVIVRGAVKGDVTAEDGIRLEEGARVVGDLRAPRVAVTRGALVRGHVQTSGSGTDESRSSARAKSGRSAQKDPAHSRLTPATRTASLAESNASGSNARRGIAPSLLAGGSPKTSPKGPPPPVVPVLRKGSKGTLKKRAG